MKMSVASSGFKSADVLAVHGQVIPRFIGQDGRHLSNGGIKVLAANLRSAVENVLKIGTYRRRRYVDRSEHYGNYFSRLNIISQTE
jgi:hypothetical protein